MLEQILGEDFWVIVMRLFIALLLSGLIGFERELKNHSAGFRTHILVGVGSCLMMILSLFAFIPYMELYDHVQFDPARIPSYVISGIGFLGAGTIIVYGGTIRGLTTAASIWTVAGIGLVVGAGMYSIAIVTTIIILISLIFLNHIDHWFSKAKHIHVMEIMVGETVRINQVMEIVEKYGLTVIHVEIIKEDHNHRKIYIKTERVENMNHLEMFEEITRLDQVISITELVR